MIEIKGLELIPSVVFAAGSNWNIQIVMVLCSFWASLCFFVLTFSLHLLTVLVFSCLWFLFLVSHSSDTLLIMVTAFPFLCFAVLFPVIVLQIISICVSFYQGSAMWSKTGLAELSLSRILLLHLQSLLDPLECVQTVVVKLDLHSGILVCTMNVLP